MKSFKQYILEAEDDELNMDMDTGGDEDNSEDSNDSENSEDSEDSEDKEDSDKKKSTQRGNIKFVIWEEPEKKVSWLKDNDKYQKIEYKHEDKKKNIFIDFLLGFDKEENTWKLWVGKIGAVNYDDDPYCDFETESFASAIVKALDKVEEFIKNVEDEPENWIQYYKNI